MLKRLSLALVSLYLTGNLYANPEGFQLIAGDATPPTADAAGVLVIESGKSAIIHWDSFSISKDEITRFVQQDSKSAVLNRVMGSMESMLSGSLESNGSVLLINPQGIVINKGARIDTAGFLASTSDVLNEDFLSGTKLVFSGSSEASVVNLGTIHCSAGDVALIARTVRNEGDITASQGVVSLGGGKEVLLQLEGPERMFIQPSGGEGLVEHLGSIKALSVEIKSAGTPYAQAIRSSGRIDALSRHEENGRVYLVANQGRVDVTGDIHAEGGEVRVLGDYVRVDGNAVIDVSGRDGGGEVLVGGDFQGKNPDVRNADVAYVGKDAEIHADALGTGDGGKVIVWSDKATGFYGKVSAEGGKESGDGGFVEVSGKYLDYTGSSSTVAPKGQTGKLYLDPNDIQITGATTGGAIFFDASYFDGSAAPGNVTLDAATVAANLVTNNVIIGTNDQVATGTGYIQVSTGFTWATQTMLTLRATGNILVDSGITIQNTSNGGGSPFGAITFIANTDHTLPGTIAGIFISDGNIITDAGDIYMDGTGGNTMMVNPGVLIQGTGVGGKVASNTGAITLIGRGGPEDTTATDGNIGVVIAGAVAGGNVTTAGPITIIGRGAGTGNGNGGVSITNNALVSGLLNSDILIDGTGNGGLAGNIGIGIGVTSIVQAASGNIRMIGRASGSTSANDGIFISASSQVISTAVSPTNASIFLDGVASASGTSSNIGVLIQDSLNAVTSTDANITIIGHGSKNSGGTNNHGISITSTASITSSGAGNVSLTGFGGENGTTGHGVFVVSGVPNTDVSTNTGNISIYGEAGAGSGSHGVLIEENGRVLSTSGDIEVTGSASPRSGNGGKGVRIHGGEVVSNGVGPGSIIIKGVSNSSGANSCIGVDLLSLNRLVINIRTRISSVDHDIIITGVGGGTGLNCVGISLNEDASSTLATQVESTGTGSIFLDGKGSQTPLTGLMTAQENHGVFITGLDVANNAFVQTNSGDIVINGSGGVGDSVGVDLPHCNGIFLSNFGRVTTATGNIKMTGDATGTLENNNGIQLLDNCTIESTSMGVNNHSIILEGSGSQNGTVNNMGVNLQNNCVVQSATNDISIIGYGGRQSTGGNNHGINIGLFGAVVAPCTVQSTMGGNITLTGMAGFNTNVGGDGVVINNPTGGPATSKVSTTTGDIQIYGQGNSFGVHLFNFGEVVTTDGNISIVGEAFGAGDKNDGILVDSNSLVHATGMGRGSIILNGTGSLIGGNLGFGVLVDNTSTITSVTHDIDITGKGGGTIIGNGGIALFHGSTITSTGAMASAATIRLNGTGGDGINANVGIYLSDPGTTISSIRGNITLLGQGRGTGANNAGMTIDLTSQILSTGDAAITLNGQGSTNGTNGNLGIVTSANGSTTISSVDGDITFIGTGGGTGTGNAGILLLTNSQIASTGTARITMNGTGGRGTNSNVGTSIFGITTLVTSTHGDIFIQGQGNGNGIQNHGISVSGGATIRSLGTFGVPPAAKITLNGTGSFAATDTNSGVFLADQMFGPTLQAIDGNITIIGQGGGSGGSNHGIIMQRCTLNSSVGAPYNFALTLNGTGGPGLAGNIGVLVDLNTHITVDQGDIFITGIGGGRMPLSTGNYGVEISNSASITSTGLGATSVNGKTVQIEGIGGTVGLSNNYGVLIALSGLITCFDHDLNIRAESGAGTAEAMRIITSGAISNAPAQVSNIDIVTRSFDGSGGDFNISTVGSLSNATNISMKIARDLVFSGSGAAGSNVIQATTGNISLDIGRDLTMTGGGGPNALTAIKTDTGITTISVGRDVTLTGGAGNGAFAQIGSPIGTGNIHFPLIGGNLSLNGDSYALIGHGVQPPSPLSGDIIFDFIGGSVTLNGTPAPGAIDGFAQIGHLNSSVMSINISGNIFVNAAGSITLNGGAGGSTSADGRARIGHGGVPSAMAPVVTNTNITLFAGSNIVLNTQFGQAQIENLATNVGSGAITLITDNVNPLNPAFGASSFQMNTGSLIANQFASSGAQVRIYTVTPPQNILSPNLNINGFVFNTVGAPPNTTYEKFSIWYGSGIYGGPEFTLYYKLPVVICSCPSGGGSCLPSAPRFFFPPINTLAIANTQLTEMLPVLKTDYYHGEICTLREKLSKKSTCLKPCSACDPDYPQFHAFIFENRVY